MTSLDKVLLAAGLLEPAGLGGAHEHLMKECSWYAHVDGGGKDAPEKHCKGAGQGKVVKLTPRTAEASTVVQPTVAPGGPGLFHMKGRHLPPYVEHLYKHLVARYGKHQAYGVAIGIVRKWASGVNPGGWKSKSGKGKRTHADVQAAAAKNVAEWEKDKADAHAHRAAGHAGGDVKATVSLSAPAATAQSAKPDMSFGLKHVSAPTAAAGSPKPPDSPLPTVSEIRALVAQVPECSDASLSASARKHLEAVVVKLGKNDMLEALHMLRSVQSDVYAAHKADLGANGPQAWTANVFARVPGAEMAQANTAMIRGRDREAAWRSLEQAVAGAIGKIRRRFFHGQVNGIASQARFSGERPLDKVLRLSRADLPV